MLKVGLVGWACRSGLGQLNHDLARLAPWVTAWLVPEHPEHGVDPALLPPRTARVCRVTGDAEIYERFLDDVDAVLFAERQYVREDFDLAAEARARGRVVCGIPMMEFLRDDEHWLSAADLVWAPTRWSAVELEALARRRAALARATGDARFHSPWARSIVGGRLGADPELFRFRLRERARRFLFVNGRGGYRDRKGADLMARAAALAPEVPLRVLSQAELPAFHDGVETLHEDRPDRISLYDEGDVLVAPSRWEGFGCGLYEAQARGLPILATDAPPMDECGGRLIPVAGSRVLEADRALVSHEVDPKALAGMMRAIHGEDLASASRRARERVVRDHDLRDTIRELGAMIAAAVDRRTAGVRPEAGYAGRPSASASSSER